MSLTLPAFWNIANQFTSKFDWSSLLENPHWVERPSEIPNLTKKMRHAFTTMTDRPIDVSFITIFDPEYPERLKSVPFAPPILFYSGNIGLLHRPSVAILGSRRCTQQGVIRSRALARYFGPTHNIIGGLTKGIEYQAQRALLEQDSTSDCPLINITTQGFTQIQGWAKCHLDHTLQRGGLALSEWDGPRPYQKWQYAQRNRIIAAMASIAIVVEAGAQSGSVQTATMAAELGVDVLTFPHQTTLSHGQGCNVLIEQGASAIHSHSNWLSDDNTEMVDFLHSPKTLDTIAEHLDMSIEDTFHQLLIWQSQGQLRQRGNLWERH